MIDSKHGETVRASIIHVGLALWRDGGERAVTLGKIGAQVNLSRQAVAYHYGSAGALREAVAQAALDRRDVRVVSQMITARHPLCEGMTGGERAAWLAGC